MPALAELGIGRLMIGKAAEYVPHIALELHTIRTSPLISDNISPTVAPNAQCVPATAVGVKIIPVKTLAIPVLQDTTCSMIETISVLILLGLIFQVLVLVFPKPNVATDPARRCTTFLWDKAQRVVTLRGLTHTEQLMIQEQVLPLEEIVTCVSLAALDVEYVTANRIPNAQVAL
jgi:hypothetical protein